MRNSPESLIIKKKDDDNDDDNGKIELSKFGKYLVQIEEEYETENSKILKLRFIKPGTGVPTDLTDKYSNTHEFAYVNFMENTSNYFFTRIPPPPKPNKSRFWNPFSGGIKKTFRRNKKCKTSRHKNKQIKKSRRIYNKMK